ncbi:hypothetical protein AAFO90_24035, partial [Phaeobacter sp. CAU 1743]|uniref:hypothetical protein n=1 Tax=Phaeobacter sp. CAU 1743 TaxID=3140367 RepID=UPI00325AF9B8
AQGGPRPHLSTQTALRSFKPPFWKLESDFSQLGNPECPQTLMVNCGWTLLYEFYSVFLLGSGMTCFSASHANLSRLTRLQTAP